MDVENGNKQREQGTIEFTGEGKAPGGIDYKLKTTFGGSEETGMSVMKNGAGNIAKGSFGGCVVVQEDEVVEVEINWYVQ